MGEFLSKLGNPSALLAFTQPWLFKANTFHKVNKIIGFEIINAMTYFSLYLNCNIW
jgi:hypothetical protein